MTFVANVKEGFRAFYQRLKRVWWDVHCLYEIAIGRPRTYRPLVLPRLVFPADSLYDAVTQVVVKSPIVESQFKKIYSRWGNHTMVPVISCYNLFTAAKYVIRANIPGDVCECGVWQGGSSLIMAETLGAYGETSRIVYMYDTFSGMSEPSDKDVSLTRNQRAADLLAKYKKGEQIWCCASYEEVQANVLLAEYPTENFRLIAGDVATTLRKIVPAQLSILRLDTDWYESTKLELEYLFPRLSSGGILMIDDYGIWRGARDAVDEYFRDNKIEGFFHIDPESGGAMMVKQ